MSKKIMKVWMICLGLLSLSFIAILIYQGIINAIIHSNEGHTVGNLRSISTALSQFQAQCIVDQDRDGIGEYGFLQEVSGVVKGRSGKQVSSSEPWLLKNFSNGIENSGIVQKDGYYYLLYLPGKNGSGREIFPLKKETDSSIIDQQENYWICYAWPVDYGYTGIRAYCIDIGAEVHGTSNRNKNYHGLEKIPKATSAMEKEEKPTESEFARLASGTEAIDGLTWSAGGWGG